MKLNMDTIVQELNRKGITASVEQTGGGVATILIGEGNDEGYDLAAGPGWFEGPGWTNGRGDTDEFWVGPDRTEGEGGTYVPSGWTEKEVVAEIVRQFALR